jgi:hypothetical protein
MRRARPLREKLSTGARSLAAPSPAFGQLELLGPPPHPPVFGPPGATLRRTESLLNQDRAAAARVVAILIGQ